MNNKYVLRIGIGLGSFIQAFDSRDAAENALVALHAAQPIPDDTLLRIIEIDIDAIRIEDRSKLIGGIKR